MNPVLYHAGLVALVVLSSIAWIPVVIAGAAFGSWLHRRRSR